jgi:hypothetical protein
MTPAELVHVVDEEAGTYSFRGKLDTVEVTSRRNRLAA